MKKIIKRFNLSLDTYFPLGWPNVYWKNPFRPHLFLSRTSSLRESLVLNVDIKSSTSQVKFVVTNDLFCIYDEFPQLKV